MVLSFGYDAEATAGKARAITRRRHAHGQDKTRLERASNPPAFWVSNPMDPIDRRGNTPSGYSPQEGSTAVTKSSPTRIEPVRDLIAHGVNGCYACIVPYRRPGITSKFPPAGITLPRNCSIFRPRAGKSGTAALRRLTGCIRSLGCGGGPSRRPRKWHSSRSRTDGIGFIGGVRNRLRILNESKPE